MCDDEREFINKYPSSKLFIKECLRHIEQYIDGNSYDVLPVCIAIRVMAENILYLLLDDNFKKEFLENNGGKKIEFAEKCIDIPEYISVLRFFYNEPEHMTEHTSETIRKRIYAIINTNPIRNIIRILFEKYKQLSQ